MVCKTKGEDDYRGGRKVIETEAVRPTDTDYSNQIIQADKYGHGKLCCEEVLNEAFKRSQFPGIR
jgi:hypothetical protein